MQPKRAGANDLPPPNLTPEALALLAEAQGVGQRNQTNSLPPPILTGASLDGSTTPDKPPEDRRDIPRKPRSVDEAIVEAVTGVYLLMALLWRPFNEYDATVIALKSEDMAKGVLALGHQHKEIYVWLERFSRTNAYVLFAKPHLETLGAIGQNHGFIGGGMLPGAGGSNGMAPGPATATPSVPFAAPSSPPSPSSPTPPTAPAPPPGNIPPELMQKLIQQAVAQQTAAREAGYNPSDTAPRAEHNPALNLVPRIS